MTDQEMSQLILETMNTQYEADGFSTDNPTRATAHPGATQEEISRLEEHLRMRGLSLAPSFAQFLRIHNGIEDYISSMELSIRSTQQIENSQAQDARWKDIFPAYRFIIASGDNSSALVGFVPESMDDHGEMRVIYFDRLRICSFQVGCRRSSSLSDE
jgi:hypothetical protein